MWSEDEQHGAGIQVAGNKYQFAGNFKEGERTVRKNRLQQRGQIHK